MINAAIVINKFIFIKFKIVKNGNLNVAKNDTFKLCTLMQLGSV